jgi:peptidyl-prolyl cis-trans isomerase D
MLRFFSRFQRSQKFILIFFCAILLIGLILFYIPSEQIDPSARVNTSTADDQAVIAEVGSEEITLKEFRLRLQQFLARVGQRNSFPLIQLKSMGLDKTMLDDMINNRIALDQAARLNLTATDREVSDNIKQQFKDKNGKFVGTQEYKNRLVSYGMDIEQFEKEVRDGITVSKFRNFLTSNEQVSDREVEDKYKKDNTKVETVYATINLEKVRKSYQPTEDELKAFYEAHKAEFKATEPTYRVDYIFIPSDEVSKTIVLTDEQLRKAYESDKQQELRASIIKLNVLAPQDNETVRKKIEDLASRVRGTGAPGTKAEDFAVVARGNSMDASASKGGDIGWIKREPNKPNDWMQRVYTNNMEVGQIEGPFEEGKSWYLMKVTEKRDVPFERERARIKATTTNNETDKKVSQLADKAYDKAKENKDLRKGAEVIASELKVTPESLIKSTPYFKKGDPLPSLGKGQGYASTPAFEEAVSALKKGEIGEKVRVPGGQVVPMVVDILENSQQMSYEQARNQVEDKLRRENEPALARERAQQIVNQSNSVEDFKRLAKAEGLEVKTDSNLSTYSFSGAVAGSAATSNLAKTALLGLKEGDVYKTPIKVGAEYLIFAAVKRTEADLSKLSAERDTIRDSIQSERERAAYEAFIKSTRKQYEEQGKVKVYQDRIDKFFASALPEQ